jgi:hypothetical protein
MLVPNIYLIIIGIWLVILSGVIIFVFFYFRRAIKITKIENTRNLLDKINARLIVNEEDTKKIKKVIDKINTQDIGHLQRMGLIRFNPFNEIGGDHSFSLAILDGADNGIIVTGLHTRDRSRIYAKPVVNGKCELELSAEEKKALLKAQKV